MDHWLLQPRDCRCGCRLNKLGHHHAACSRGSTRQRGRRTSGNQRVHPRSGPRGVQHVRQLPTDVIADGLTLWQGAQLAMDTTLVWISARRRLCQTESSGPHRSGFESGQAQEGNDPPRTRRGRRRKSPSGRFGRRGGRQVVQRDFPYSARIGKILGGDCAHDPPGMGRGGVGAPSSEGFLRVTPGTTTGASHGGRVHDTRRVEGGQAPR